MARPRGVRRVECLTSHVRLARGPAVLARPRVARRRVSDERGSCVSRGGKALRRVHLGAGGGCPGERPRVEARRRTEASRHGPSFPASRARALQTRRRMSSVAHEAYGDLKPGERIGDRWIVREPIGSGGHATVYRAEHVELGHSVAIKVLHLDRCGSAADEMLGRFRREARIAARIQHRNVVRVFDWGELDSGWPYFVMQLVPGEDLQALIDREGALPIAAAVDVGLQALAGLGALAELGVVHRDVKPGNVMIETRPSGARIARMVDLGIASTCDHVAGPRFTLEGTVLGTPEYMSPEQIRGMELDHRADVYSLGVVLYEALTGVLPFHGKGPCATLAMALTQEPARVIEMRPDCPPEIDAIVMRALEKDREARFDSARAMASALAEAADACGLPRGVDAWRAADALESDVVGIHAEVIAADEALAPHASRPAKRPAARARHGAVRPLPRVDPAAARALDDSTRFLREGPTSTTVRLKARARAPLGALRALIAVVALGVATALGVRAATGAVMADLPDTTTDALQTHIVPAQPPHAP
ncbi:serine/threonine protein kinase [Sandaracinus amylolyticus]|uniref:Serine/threonine protein kinase n=2 Tax=Sandaracinus amylolyticus TaxID=927083 RepID=A0A0F6YHA0_9BACT|nr:serine/threonine protein kinase [Sandaracinus amylolyticus]